MQKISGLSQEKTQTQHQGVRSSVNQGQLKAWMGGLYQKGHLCQTNKQLHLAQGCILAPEGSYLYQELQCNHVA